MWLRNNGSGNFAPPTTLVPVAPPGNFYIADFNRDGKPDILYWTMSTSSGNSVLHTFVNHGGGSFSDQADPNIDSVPFNSLTNPVVNVMDFNLDGIPDVVIQVALSGGGASLTSYQGNGDGSFTQVATQNFYAPEIYGPVRLLAAGDFDHDGLPDLAGSDGESSPSHAVFFGAMATGISLYRKQSDRAVTTSALAT